MPQLFLGKSLCVMIRKSQDEVGPVLQVNMLSDRTHQSVISAERQCGVEFKKERQFSLKPWGKYFLSHRVGPLADPLPPNTQRSSLDQEYQHHLETC